MEQYILVIGVIVIVAVLLILHKLTGKSNKGFKKDIMVRIGKIDDSMKDNNPIALKNGLIEIDKLFDHVMKEYGYKGETMGERLKSVQKRFDKKTYNQIWEAHKIRNKLVHDVGFEVQNSELKTNYQNMKRGLLKLM